MKHVSVVLAVLLLGVAVLVGILGLGAPSASAAPEGGFDLVQTAAFAKGTTIGSIGFLLDVDRTVKQPPTDLGSAASWTIEIEFGGDFFEDEGPTVGLDINFNTGRATLNTDLEGCGEVDVTWEASGEEFRSDNTFADGEGVEVRVVKSVKLTDVSGTVCDVAIDTVEENAQIIVESFYCRGDLTKQECKDLRNDIPSAPEA